MRLLAGLSSCGVIATGVRYSCLTIVVIGALLVGACLLLRAAERHGARHA